MTNLRFEHMDRDGTFVVALCGDAGIATADVFEREVIRILARQAPVVVLDLSQLSFISSLAMGLLVSLQRGLLMRGGQLCAAGAQPKVMESLVRAQLDRLISIHESMEQVMGQKKMSGNLS